MPLFLELMLAMRYLRAKKRQFFFSVITLFSLLGVSLGVAILIIVMSVMNGFSEQLLESILGINGHISVLSEPGDDYEKISKDILSIKGVHRATPLTENQVIIKTGANNVSGAIVRGLDFSSLINGSVISSHIVSGQISDDGIVIGARLAENLGVVCDSKITLISPESFSTILGQIPRMKTVKIVGIFDIGMYEYDSTMVYMPLAMTQKFFNYGNSVKAIEVFVKNIEKSAEVATVINSETGSEAQDWKVQQRHYFNALETEKNVMFFILMLIIIVATFNIISSLTILVEEKKSSIAIMRTMGVTRAGIMRIFCFCGCFIGIVGTTLGCVLGVAFALNIQTIQSFLESTFHLQLFDPVLYFFSTLPSILLFKDVMSIVFLSLLLSFFATIFPARKAASYNPADILRYE